MLGDVHSRSEAIAAPRRLLVPAALLRLESDERLVGHVRAGSDRAFEVVFDRHHKPLLAFCRHMLGSASEAEEAVQDTFLAAYRGLTESAKPIVLRPWLYTIARHRCISILRARREHPVKEVPEPATANLAAEVAARDDLRTLLADVGRLPEEQRAALVLAELGDLSHDQIATVLGCRPVKVRALVFQARSNLAAARTAREASCREIREHIAIPAGGELSRSVIRRHLAVCEGCRDFRDEVRVQRRDLAVLLPVVPSLGLKASVLGAIGGGGGGAAAAAGTLLGGGVAATSLVTVAVVGSVGAVGVGLIAPRERAPGDTAARWAPALVIPRDEPAANVRLVSAPPARHAGTRADRAEIAADEHGATSDRGARDQPARDEAPTSGAGADRPGPLSGAPQGPDRGDAAGAPVSQVGATPEEGADEDQRDDRKRPQRDDGDDSRPGDARADPDGAQRGQNGRGERQSKPDKSAKPDTADPESGNQSEKPDKPAKPDERNGPSGGETTDDAPVSENPDSPSGDEDLAHSGDAQ